MLALIRRAFSARPPVDPPAEALVDTLADVAAAVRDGVGLLATVDDELVGCLLIEPAGETIALRRVCVDPDHRQGGVAGLLVRTAGRVGVERGASRVELVARSEFPDLIKWWNGHGFAFERPAAHGFVLSRPLPVRLAVATPDEMRALGARLAESLTPGDVIIADGELGAGKTTLAQGVGAGMGVEEQVTSPTFVLSRVHPNPRGPALVHVDAYRLSSALELSDIDLEATLAESVTLIEWGAGLAEWLSGDRLEVSIEVEPDGETRQVWLTGQGASWVERIETLRPPK